MFSLLPEAIIIALLTVFAQLGIAIYNRRYPARKDAVDTSKVKADAHKLEADTAKILVDASGTMVSQLTESVEFLKSEQCKQREENFRTINELQERINLVNRQYTDYILATDERLDDLERENKELRKENKEIKAENKELRRRISDFIEKTSAI